MKPYSNKHLPRGNFKKGNKDLERLQTAEPKSKASKYDVNDDGKVDKKDLFAVAKEIVKRGRKSKKK